MSQRRRRRSQEPVEAPRVAPPPEVIPEPEAEPEVGGPDEILARQTPFIAYGLTVALIAMLLVCAVAIYIAAP